MPCNLRPDPSGAYDFMASAGAGVTLKVAGTTGLAGIASAMLNQKPLSVSDSDTLHFIVRAGINILRFSAGVSDPEDTVKVFEESADGDSETLDEFESNPNDPVTGYTIFGVEG
jgi:hypothetical protein